MPFPTMARALSALVLLLGAPALAQTPPAAAGGPGAEPAVVIVPALPSPELPANASPNDYLRAARGALATGRTGEAQQALEMAETRALDRSVPLFQTNTPSKAPLVARIRAARDALGTGDRSATMRAIDAALAGAHAP
jgi:hypothetical protein